jgi:hypothetical protein
MRALFTPSLSAVAILGIVGASSLAFANSWRATAALGRKSPVACRIEFGLRLRGEGQRAFGEND